MVKILGTTILMVLVNLSLGNAQDIKQWNNKECAVVLTYDDSIDGHLDNVIPTLDSLKLNATFYLIGSSAAVAMRIQEWRVASKNGHELGNHTLNHPCDGSLAGRDFVTKENDLSTYSLARAIKEIKLNNTLLEAIDGKSKRSFAYPCGDLKVEGVNFYEQVKNDFVGARGVSPGFETLGKVNLANIKTYAINGQSSKYMIDLVKEAQKTQSLVVFLFHGVEGGHSLNVDLKAHNELLHYLKNNEKQIWVAPMVTIADYIKKKQTEN